MDGDVEALISLPGQEHFGPGILGVVTGSVLSACPPRLQELQKSHQEFKSIKINAINIVKKCEMQKILLPVFTNRGKSVQLLLVCNIKIIQNRAKLIFLLFSIY